jgi:hypothetical protein
MGVKQWLGGATAGAVLVAGGLTATSLIGSPAGAQGGIPGVEEAAGPAGPDRPLRSALDALVAEGTLTQAQADEVHDALVSERRELRAERREGRRERRERWAEVVAGVVGVTPDELRAELAAGRTVAEIAAAHGTTADAVVAGLVAEVTARLDAEVAEGTLSQEQADRLEDRAAVRIERRIQLPMPPSAAADDAGGS